tara:strand:- start:3488 stop:4666 length:1179 start_codon:yes stop_codon:yes gene_type:complete
MVTVLIMAENKNQHFVPKCHFKPFTLNGEGRAINLFNHSNDKMIENASVDGQCSKSYFYGEDLKLEKILQAPEGDYATIVKKMSENAGDLTIQELTELKHFAFLQMNRTEANVKRRAIAHRSFDEIAHRGFEEYRKAIIDTSHKTMLLSTMQTYAKSLYSIRDLEASILENKTKVDFITSDDPSILINRLYLQKLGGRAFGMVSSGVQLVMPLTPRFYLICYDKHAYAGHRNGYRIVIDKVKDVLALNELQFIKSQTNIYFRNWEQRDQIKVSFQESKARRPASWLKFWIGIPTSDKNGNAYYRRAEDHEISSAKQKIICHHSIHVEPSRWLSVLRFRPKIYGYTNGSAVGYVREGHIDSFKDGYFWKEEIIYSPKKFDPQTMAHIVKEKKY